MPEIACTTFGRHALVTGLISHGAAILVAMMSVSGGGLFVSMVFPFSCLALVIGAYAELRNRDRVPLRDGRFYVIAAVTVFPVLGPLIVFGLLYRLQQEEQHGRVSVSGLFSAMVRLRANALVLFVVIIVLFLLFAVIHSRHDPYFKRRVQHGHSSRLVVTDGRGENQGDNHGTVEKHLSEARLSSMVTPIHESRYPCERRYHDHDFRFAG